MEILVDAWLLQLSAQAIESLFCIDSPIQRKMIEKRGWRSRGGRVGEGEEVCVGDRGGLVERALTSREFRQLGQVPQLSSELRLNARDEI